MKQFGYPKEYRGCIAWSDRPMRFVGGKLFWGERDGYWWSEDGDEFYERDSAMSLHLSDTEGTHRLLFEAHWALVKASERIHTAIVAIHAAGRYAESRHESKEPLAALEKARDAIDEALRAASDGRSKLIHKTGCDGTCSDNISSGAAVPQS